MPSLNGVITIHENREVAAQCDNGDAALAEQACAEEELKLYKISSKPGRWNNSEKTDDRRKGKVQIS